MHDRNWFSYVALGLIAGIGLTLVLVTWLEYSCGPICQTYLYGGTLDKSNNNENTIIPGERSGDPIQHSIAPQNPENPDFYTHYNLEAQQSMARSTAVIVQMTVFSIIIGFIASIAIVWTLFETRNSIVVTRDIGEAQVRAYLVHENGTLQVTDSAIYCSIPISNIGQSPALQVKCAGFIEFQGEHAGRPVAIQRLKVAAHIRDNIFPRGQAELSLFCNVEGNPARTSSEDRKPGYFNPMFPSYAAHNFISGKSGFFAAEVVVGWTDVFSRRWNITFTFGGKLSDETGLDYKGDRMRTGTLTAHSSRHYNEVS